MTAAGTVPPAEVLVLGAGVAGLQAIATAAGSGASSRRTTCGRASADEVRSMGRASSTSASRRSKGAGGYAREMAEERGRAAAQLLAPYVARPTPSSPPPRSRPAGAAAGHHAMVEAMQPGSVVVDLAAESGGNCELSVPGEDVVHGGVLVTAWGRAVAMPVHASQLYAATSQPAAADDHGRRVVPDFDDEIVAGACVDAARRPS
jgi:NAD(P) transhydrogenase subunit alpha